MQGIKKIIKYIGFPFLIIGILVGFISGVQLNLYRPILSDVKELCSGPDCKDFMAAKELEVKKTVEYSEEEIKRAVDDMERYKKVANDKTSEASSALASTKIMKEILIKAFPTEFYCYSNNREEEIELGYQEDSIEIVSVPIKDIIMKWEYMLEQCALCDFDLDGEYNVYCQGRTSQWYATNGRDAQHCNACSGDVKKCEEGEINQESVIKVNKTISLKLKRGVVSIVKIPENISFEQKVELTKEIKKHDCYASKLIEKSSLFKEEDLEPKDEKLFFEENINYNIGVTGGGGEVYIDWRER